MSSVPDGDELLKRIRGDLVVQDVLARLGDFEVLPAGAAWENPGWFSFGPGTQAEAIAAAGNGDWFFLTVPRRHLLYVTVDAQAGVIARNLVEGVCLMIDVPHWHDLLKFSGGGVLEEMKRVAPFCEQSVRQLEPNVDQLRETVRRRLALSRCGDSIALLHSAVHELSGTLNVLARDGSPMDSLFNRFTAHDLMKPRRSV